MKLRIDLNLLILLAMALLFVATRAPAAPADLDTTFGGTGKVTTQVGQAYAYGWPMAVQDDGKILVASDYAAGANFDIAVVRYNSNGSLDETFNGTGIATTSFSTGSSHAGAIAVQADGRIVLTGYYNNGTQADLLLVRYNSDGTLDTSFNGTGKVVTDTGSANDGGYGLALQNDGRILVAASGSAATVLVRYNSDGSLDAGFNGTGKVFRADAGIGSGNCLALQNDGRIVVAGSIKIGANNVMTLARYLSNGAADGSFGDAGKVVTTVGTGSTVGTGVVVQGDGKLLVTGFSGTYPNEDFALVRFLADGSLDTSFGGGTGKVITDIAGKDDNALAVTLQRNGKILVAGPSVTTQGYDFTLVRYNANGSLDSTFNGTGKVSTDVVGHQNDFNFGMAVQADGKIVLSGYTYVPLSDGLGSPRIAVVRYLGDQPPIVSPGNTANLTAIGARLSGLVNPNGLVATARFEYGLTSAYGSTADVTLAPDNGNSPQAVSAALVGLAPSTVYHYRLTAANEAGSVNTPDAIFTTLSRIDAWRAANFDANANNDSIAGDLANPDGDALCNLLEYAFAGDPNADGPEPEPTTSLADGKLTIIFTRVPENDDLDYLVQASNDLQNWTDLARSHAGAATASLISGVQVSETGAGANRTVEVVDFEPAGSLPQRFLRIQVVRP